MHFLLKHKLLWYASPLGYWRLLATLRCPPAICRFSTALPRVCVLQAPGSCPLTFTSYRSIEAPAPALGSAVLGKPGLWCVLLSLEGPQPLPSRGSARHWVLLSAAVVSSPPGNSGTSVAGHLACFHEARAAACHHWVCARPSLAQRWEETCFCHSSVASLLLCPQPCFPGVLSTPCLRTAPCPRDSGSALGTGKTAPSCGERWAAYVLFLPSFTVLVCHLVLGFLLLLLLYSPATFSCATSCPLP